MLINNGNHLIAETVNQYHLIYFGRILKIYYLTLRATAFSTLLRARIGYKIDCLAIRFTVCQKITPRCICGTVIVDFCANPCSWNIENGKCREWMEKLGVFVMVKNLSNYKMLNLPKEQIPPGLRSCSELAKSVHTESELCNARSPFLQ